MTGFPTSSPLTVAVYSSNNPDDGCGYLRLFSPCARAGMVQLWGAKAERRFFIKRLAVNEELLRTCDVVVIQRSFPRRATRQFLDRLFRSGLPVIYDMDDLLTEVPAEHPYRRNLCGKASEMAGALRRATAVTVSTPALAERYRELNSRIAVFPNLLDETLWGGDLPERAPGPVRIVFAGGKSHVRDLAIIEEALERIGSRYGGRVEFHIFGTVPPRLRQMAGVVPHPFCAYGDYAKRLMALRPDIGLAPLEDNAFNGCKSNIKWLEYAAAGGAGIFSRIAAYDTVRNGETGLLVENASSSWFEAIARLVEEDDLRARLAAAARHEVTSSYLLAAGTGRFADFYRSIAASGAGS